MITRIAIEERGREWGLREDVVEKDYALGWLLWGIGSDADLSLVWIFKGGTCLKKCYVETWRFSEDLDFTVLPGGPILSENVLPILQRVLQTVGDASGLNFTDRPPQLKTHDSGLYTEGRVYYRGPRNASTVASIRLDLSASEKIARPSVLRKITHEYPDELPAPATVRCYSFEEVFAEKIRAMGERSRPRDLYDIIHLFRRRDLQSQPKLIREVLEEKCRSKGVAVPNLTALENSPHRTELASEWENMLGHQLPRLPPFETFWNELTKLFAWLEGSLVEAELQPIPHADTEERDREWTPPTTVWTWGMGIPIEPIRFAAANHLFIELGYLNSKRLIEPYALRRTRAGHILLCAVKVATREDRTYRLDRIQSIKVTTQPFKPVYRVEIGATGPISTPPIARASVGTSFKNRGVRRPGLVYIIRCSSCGRDFKKRNADFTLKPHKGRGGWQCHSVTGHLARTPYE